MVVKKKDKERVKTTSFRPSTKDDDHGTVDTEDFSASASVPILGTPNAEPIPKKEPPSRGSRMYIGPTSDLMNDLYDTAQKETGMGATEVDIAILNGWDRISLFLARACERLEEAGWKRA